MGDGLVHSWLDLLWYLLNPLLCEQARQCLRLELLMGKFSLSLFFFLLSLWLPQFGLLSQVSSFRLSSGHSGPVLTLNNVAHVSMFSPRFPVQPLLAGGGHECLGYFSTGSCG